MKVNAFIIFISLLLISYITGCSNNKYSRNQSLRVKNSGIFALSYNVPVSNLPHLREVLDLPWVLGGEVQVQWRELEPAKNAYDFSSITAKLEELKAKGKLATLKVHGNRKPDYLFDKVPWVDEKLSMQINDPKGTLMYWHPAHLDAYKNLLEALGEYLSGRKSDFIGIRMNYNSLGTEHWNVHNQYRDASRWNYPDGVEAGIDWPYHGSIRAK